MFDAQTQLTIEGTRFAINGKPTYRGKGAAEGLLFNVRTVNATFDDTLGVVDWWDDDGSQEGNGHAGYGKWVSPGSADENTERYIAGLPAYRAHGILAVSLNLQGGHPLNGKPWIQEASGSAGRRPNGHRDFYHNSAFGVDGRIDPLHQQRISAIIEACDRLGMAVILQLFYFGQDTALPDEDAVRAAADNATDYVCASGYRNVIIEIANEVMEGHYHHDILKPGRVTELIHRVRERAWRQHGKRVLVTTSEAALLSSRQWTEEQIDLVYSASDLVIIHGGDNIETGRVGDASELAAKVARIRSSAWYQANPRPILTNESQGQQAFEAMVRRGVSFGLHSISFQTMFPPKWGVWDNDALWFFQSVRHLTQEGGR